MRAIADLSEEFGGAMRPFRKHFGTPAFEHSMVNVFGPIVSENLIPGGANRIFSTRRILPLSIESRSVKIPTTFPAVPFATRRALRVGMRSEASIREEVL